MKHVIFDCDNTLGIQGCDVDDGLTLLYLLGCKNCRILGVTTTYGNNTLERVFENTKTMLADIGHTEIPVKRGGVSKGDYTSEASEFLAQTADRIAESGQKISILATGSLTNLLGAYQIDPHFFDNIQEIVLMGGITAPLIFEKNEMAELNFSCDPAATATVLTQGKNVSVITGNNCLKVLFTRAEYRTALADDSNKIVRFIKEKTDYWFDDNEHEYGIKGFYNWDVTAGVYLMHPELFISKEYTMAISEADLQRGFLRQVNDAEKNCILNLPEIGSERAFKENIYRTWLAAGCIEPRT